MNEDKEEILKQIQQSIQNMENKIDNQNKNIETLKNKIAALENYNLKSTELEPPPPLPPESFEKEAKEALATESAPETDLTLKPFTKTISAKSTVWPAKDKTEITYVLKENSNIRFVVTDITGKEIYSQNEGIQESGKHNIELDILRFESGVYFYSLITDKQKITKKLIIIK